MTFPIPEGMTVAEFVDQFVRDLRENTSVVYTRRDLPIDVYTYLCPELYERLLSEEMVKVVKPRNFPEPDGLNWTVRPQSQNIIKKGAPNYTLPENSLRDAFDLEHTQQLVNDPRPVYDGQPLCSPVLGAAFNNKAICTPFNSESLQRAWETALDAPTTISPRLVSSEFKRWQEEQRKK